MISRILLSQKIAKQVAEVAEKEAMENNWMVSIAIVNEAGHLLYFTKMDNTTMQVEILP